MTDKVLLLLMVLSVLSSASWYVPLEFITRIAHDKIGKRLFSSTVIPNRGAWLEYETDSNDVFYVRVDRTRKVPITVLIRALGISNNAEIVELFGEEPKSSASFAKDTSATIRKVFLNCIRRSVGVTPAESAESLIMAMFFDPRRYDLAKLAVINLIRNFILINVLSDISSETVVDPSTGETCRRRNKRNNRTC